VALGIIAGFLTLFLSLTNSSPAHKKKIFIFAVLIFVPFYIGARLGFIIESFLNKTPLYISPAGGTSLWWGVLAAVLTSIPLSRLLKTNIWETADMFAPSIAIGGFFTKIGCLFNGCCFGVPASSGFFLSTFFSVYSEPYRIYGNEGLHPTQLYEALSWLVIFFILIIKKREVSFNGELIMICGFCYSAARFFIDFFRHHETTMLLSLSVSHFYSAAVIIVVPFLFVLKTRQNRRR